MSNLHSTCTSVFHEGLSKFNLPSAYIKRMSFIKTAQERTSQIRRMYTLSVLLFYYMTIVTIFSLHNYSALYVDIFFLQEVRQSIDYVLWYCVSFLLLNELFY